MGRFAKQSSIKGDPRIEQTTPGPKWWPKSCTHTPASNNGQNNNGMRNSGSVLMEDRPGRLTQPTSADTFESFPESQSIPNTHRESIWSAREKDTRSRAKQGIIILGPHFADWLWKLFSSLGRFRHFWNRAPLLTSLSAETAERCP